MEDLHLQDTERKKKKKRYIAGAGKVVLLYVLLI